ncbi:MAG: conjugal transfer protein TraG [Sphingomonadaceae bacterium]|nr:conjugal transfer protein TraG [Sphingomonadaceae bacterium]
MLDVFTVGGGEYLVNMFNAVAAWSGSGGFKSLIRVVMVMGLIYALLVTAMNLDWRVWFRWFLQSTLVYSCLMVPTVTVRVVDRVNPGLPAAAVGNVPLGLGVMASFTSQVGDYLTRTAETVFVMPAQLQYSNGGIVYGARLWDKAMTFQVKDPVFRGNLDNYMKQCLYYDILLGTADIAALADSTDLWNDIGAVAATNRGILYTQLNGAVYENVGMTCQQAWNALNGQWATYLGTYVPRFAQSFYPDLTTAAANAKIAADLPVVGNLFTGSAAPANQVLRQNALVDVIEGAQLNFGDDEADAFALTRADTQARNSMTGIAQQAMTWVPVLNVILTMIFYAMFVVVFPLFLFPKTGVSTLKGYFGGFFYLAAWGPIYVLLHMFLMDRMARMMTAETPGGLTLAGWGGADAVTDDMATMAGMLMMSVPVLAGILARGAGAVASSAGSFFSAAQGGAEAASIERTTGNYAYGNSSFSNFSANTRQANKWDERPEIDYGAGRSAFHYTDGRVATDFGNGRPVMNASGGIDLLPFKPMWNQGYTSNLRAQGQAYLNEADRIENSTAETWRSGTGRFGSSTSADSSATGNRWAQGSSNDVTNSTGGNVTVSGSSSDTRNVSAGVTSGVREGTRDSSTWSLGLGPKVSYGDERGGGGGGGGENGEGDGGQKRGALDWRTEGDAGWRGSRDSYDDSFSTAEQRRGRDQSIASGVTVSGNSGTVRSGRQYSSNEEYGDRSHTEATTTGTDWRISEDQERRRAAAHYRELGTRMVNEADYSESSGFNMSQDMSNVIGSRYRDLQRQHPELMLPDLSDPNLSMEQMRRRDQGIRMVTEDLLGDIQRRDFSELGDVSRIGAAQPPSTVGGRPAGIGPLERPGLSPEGGLGPAGQIEGGDYNLVALGRGERAALPVAGRVRSGLGGRVNPVTGERGEHNGIDIPAARGTPVILQAGGVVERIDFQENGAGNYVVINHGNGVLTKYFHLDQRSGLVPGRRVDAGAVVGNVGSTGRSTGPHLHYEVWRDGAPVDPRRFAIRRASGD